MPKYAYLREDGRYDLYDVEPKTVTAAEYAQLKQCEELEARKAQLLVQRAAIDAELAEVMNKLKGLGTHAAEPTAASTPVNTTSDGKRKW